MNGEVIRWLRPSACALTPRMKYGSRSGYFDLSCDIINGTGRRMNVGHEPHLTRVQQA